MKTLFRIVLISIACSSCHMEGGKKSAVQGNGSGENELFNVENNKNTELSPVDYVTWVRNPENGLLKKKTIEELTFSAQYKPIEYVACLEVGKSTIPESVLKSKKEELQGMEYVDLKIEIPEGQGELLKHELHSAKQYDERISYFSFQMQKDIFLVIDKDTVPCSLFHFERAFDVAPSSTFLLGFSKGAKAGSAERTLVFHDQTFHKGFIKLNFKASDLLNIPKLKTI